MKIAGKKISGPNVETIIIPRGNSDPIIFHAQAVLDMKPFEEICPLPKPPMILKRGVGLIPDIEDENFKLMVQNHSEKRYAYIVVTSLKATPNLEWETIKENQPDTWINYEQELRDSGFSEIEIQRIVVGIMTANCLNESKLEEARRLFLLSQEVPQNGSSSQMEEHKNMPFGKPAKDSE